MTVDRVAAVLGLVLSTLALVGLAVRFILVPYLRENLVKPIQRTEHAVRANGHRDPENPTMRDQFSDVLTELRGLREDVAEVKSDVNDVKSAQIQHLAWSNEETSRLWAAIKKRP